MTDPLQSVCSAAYIISNTSQFEISKQIFDAISKIRLLSFTYFIFISLNYRHMNTHLTCKLPDHGSFFFPTFLIIVIHISVYERARVQRGTALL